MRSCRIITGRRGQGKTTKLLELINNTPNPVGFIMPVHEHGYYLLELEGMQSMPFMSDSPIFPDTIGKWYYDQHLFDYAFKKLSSVTSGSVFIDEVGRLELGGKGYAPALKMLKDRDIDLTIAVRKDFAEDIISCFFKGERVSVEELS